MSGVPAATRWPTCTLRCATTPDNGRENPRARVVEVGLVHLRGGGLDVRVVLDGGTVHERAGGGELLLRGEERRSGRHDRFGRMLDFFLRHPADRGELLAAREIGAGPLEVARALRDRCVRLPRAREKRAHLAHGAGEVRLGLRERDARIGRVQAHEHLPSLHALGIVGGHHDHGARDLRRDLHDVAAHVRVVGEFVPASHEHVPREPRKSREREDRRHEQQQARAPAFLLRGFFRLRGGGGRAGGHGVGVPGELFVQRRAPDCGAGFDGSYPPPSARMSATLASRWRAARSARSARSASTWLSADSTCNRLPRPAR